MREYSQDGSFIFPSSSISEIKAFNNSNWLFRQFWAEKDDLEQMLI